MHAFDYCQLFSKFFHVFFKRFKFLNVHFFGVQAAIGFHLLIYGIKIVAKKTVKVQIIVDAADGTQTFHINLHLHVSYNSTTP